MCRWTPTSWRLTDEGYVGLDVHKGGRSSSDPF
jgi:hypothetical protein